MHEESTRVFLCEEGEKERERREMEKKERERRGVKEVRKNEDQEGEIKSGERKYCVFYYFLLFISFFRWKEEDSKDWGIYEKS